MQRQRFIVVSICAALVLVFASETKAQDAMASVDELLGDGWNAYSEELDFESAMGAYAAVTQHPDASEDQLLEAFEYLAACRFALGDVEGARQAMTEMLSIDENHRLHDPSHSPDMLQMLEDVRGEIPPAPPELPVSTEPIETEVPPAFGTTEGGGDSGDGDTDRVRRPWYRSWWFWTITGVVVVGAVTAGIVAGTSDGGGVASPPTGELNPGVVQLPCTVRF